MEAVHRARAYRDEWWHRQRAISYELWTDAYYRSAVLGAVSSRASAALLSERSPVLAVTTEPNYLRRAHYCGAGEGESRVRYGFVIDQDRCIGCHACTVACKAENRVPLGVFRTWVKDIEKGSFPEVPAPLRGAPVQPLRRRSVHQRSARRPPCSARQRDRRFHNGSCIGCKSCMQACPYDALYIDPDTRRLPSATSARIASKRISSRPASSYVPRRLS